jgi:serine phosphatase RsbU (regulator of sigma subunit)
MAPLSGPELGAEEELSSWLRGIQTAEDAAPPRLDELVLLESLLESVRTGLGADTAAVLLLDRSASYLTAVAASGIEEEVRQGVRIPVGVGFAGRIAASLEPVILTVVNHDTVQNPLLVDRGIRSLLGVPLLAGGKITGVLHVGSMSERRFGPGDAKLLQLAAERAAAELQALMSQADAMAGMTLQHSLLPAALPAVPGASLAARYVTGTGSVGGDWYDLFLLPDGRLGITVGDVAGSGLEAAVTMGRMRSALRAYVLETTDPGDALRMLDRSTQYFEPDTMATVLYGLYSPGTGSLVLSSAGHLPPVLASPGRPAAAGLPVQPDPPIGAVDYPRRHSTTAVIPPGALLCCFTDGLVERRDEVIDAGISRVAVTMDGVVGGGRSSRVGGRDRSALVAEDACAAVMRTMVGSTAARDDITLVALHRR